MATVVATNMGTLAPDEESTAMAVTPKMGTPVPDEASWGMLVAMPDVPVVDDVNTTQGVMGTSVVGDMGETNGVLSNLGPFHMTSKKILVLSM